MRRLAVSIIIISTIIILTGVLTTTAEVWGPDAPETTSNTAKARPHVLVVMINVDVEMSLITAFNTAHHVERMEKIAGNMYRLYFTAAADLAAARQAYIDSYLFPKANYELNVSYEFHASGGCSMK